MFSSLPPANDDSGKRYITPRSAYDPAMIDDSGKRVIYDESRLLDILTSDYAKTLRLISNYRSYGDNFINYKARQLALKWTNLLRECSIYGDSRTRPIIK